MHTASFVAAAATLAVVAVAIGLWIWLFQERMVFFPSWDVERDPSAVGLEFEELHLKPEGGGEVHGWFVPCKRARCTVLFCHGNAGNVSDRLETIFLLNRLGCSVLIFDYRGYGHSSGRPTERGTYADALAAWRHLVHDRGEAPGRVVVMGRSLGCGPAIWLAMHERPAALIIESGFTSIRDMGRRAYPYLPTFLARIRYPNLDRASLVECPVLVAHSPDDEVVPYDMGRTLYAAVNTPKRFLPLRGGHNDGFLTAGSAYIEGLDAFMKDMAGL